MMGEHLVNELLPVLKMDKNNTRLSGFLGTDSKKKKGC